MDSTICPLDGEQEITRQSSTKGSDPYGIDHLACGHRVVCFGPGEPNVIIDILPARSRVGRP